MSRFDYYQATVPAYPRVIRETIAASLPGVITFLPGKGRHGYTNADLLMDSAEEVRATVYHGGLYSAPNVKFSGSDAPLGAQILREHWPVHMPTRIDVCEDFQADFEATRHVVDDLAADLKLKKGHRWVNKDRSAGDTDYWGSTQSEKQIRLYEKGKQLRSQGLVSDPDAVPIDLLRLELQWRPDKPPARLAASEMEPHSMWGVSRLAKAAVAQLLDLHPDRIATRVKMRPEFERTHAAMLKQYGPTLIKLMALTGSPDAFWLRLRDDLGLLPAIPPNRVN